MKETEALVDRTECQGKKGPKLSILSARILGRVEPTPPVLLLKSLRQKHPARPQSEHTACSSPESPDLSRLMNPSEKLLLLPVQPGFPSLFVCALFVCRQTEEGSGSLELL